MELIAALGSGDFDRLVHTAEGVWFDFKAATPDVKSPKGLRDFLADVAAFANAQGGVLLFGATGRIDESMNQEVVGQVIGVDCARVNFDQLLKLVREHIRPVLHVEIRRFDHDDGRCLVVVNVEAQADGPFLVDRLGAGVSIVPHGFGWPVRHGDGTHWETLDRVQQLISTALRLHAANHPSVPPGGDRDANAVADVELLDRLLAEQDEDLGLWAWYSVQAIPTKRGAQIADFYGEFVEAARRWRSVRNNGFGLGLDRTPLKPAAGQRATAATTRHGVVVSRTGVLTTAAVGSPGFLGWANHQGTPPELLDHVEINPFVIVEFTAETLRFATDFISHRLDSPSRWRFVARGHQLAGSERSKALYLRELPRRSMTGGFFDDPKAPLGDGFEVEVTSSDDTLADAYRLLAEVYGAGWGSSPTRVPFATDGRIDFELMASK